MPKARNTVVIGLQLFDLFTLLHLLAKSMRPLFGKLKKNPDDTKSKVELQSRLAILEQILKSDHYQKLLGKEWRLYGLKNPSLEQIVIILQRLLKYDGIAAIRFPEQVRLFCDKYLEEMENHYT